MSGQEVEDPAGGDPAVHVLAESIGTILPPGQAESLRLEVIAALNRDEHGRDTKVEGGEPAVEIFDQSRSRIARLVSGATSPYSMARPLRGGEA